MSILGPYNICTLGFFGAPSCLISGGSLKNATFERLGDVVTTSGTFSANEPVYVGGKYIHNGVITETTPTYDISPFVRPTAPDTYATAATEPNPSKRGANWEDVEEDNTWVFDLLTSTGTLTFNGINIAPSKTQWQTSGDFNILSGATGNQILYAGVDGFLYATDGTNTCKSLIEYVAGQNHTVSLGFSEAGRMRIDMDGIKGAPSDYVGTFNPGVTLKWGFANEDIFSIGSVCGTQGLVILPPDYITQDGEPVYQDGELVYL